MASIFPDIIRYRRTEASKNRLIAAFFTVQIIGFCIYMAASASSDRGKTMHTALLSLQTMVLLFYGTVRTSTSISAEKNDRTWDFQRLTPLTSWEIAIGKLIGAPIFAYFIFAVSLGWSLFALANSPGLIILDVVRQYAVLLSNSFLFLNLGLLMSAYSEGTKSNTIGTGGAVVALYGFSSIIPLVFYKNRAENSFSFFNIPFPTQDFMILSAVAFGMWAFFGAKWRIGADLLESKKFWRLPAFLLFLTWYNIGIQYGAGSYERALMFSSVFALVCSCMKSEGLDYWRRWRTLPGDELLNQVPLWIAALGTVGLVAVACAGAALLGEKMNEKLLQMSLMVPLFLGRDLFFLQWCRLTKSRRPEMMAITYIGLAYVLPGIVLSSMKSAEMLYLFLPVPITNANLFSMALPAGLQALVMGVLLKATLSKQLNASN